MGVRERINALYRRLWPAALVWEWYELLAHINERWEREHDEAALWGLAREGAATGKRPGGVLAELLIEEAARRGALP